MDSIKEKIPMIIAVILAIALCGIALYFLENYESVYYTQIDNTKIQSISATDEMKYEYTLDCYNENGSNPINKRFLVANIRSWWNNSHNSNYCSNL